MPNWKDYFKKAGGIDLLKQYWRAGVLSAAVWQFLLLGRSKKALEILRLVVSLKTQQRLDKKYAHYLRPEDMDVEHQTAKRVWIYWHQGIENAPLLVKRCFESVKRNLGDWKITVITKDNMNDYVSFPDYIVQKQQEGKITLTHFSDLLRLELLIKYGGLWLDATVLCTDGNIPKSILNADLFVYQSLKPGADGHSTLMSSWLLWAKTNNHILIETRRLLYEYWQRNDSLVDYFLLHQMFTIVCNHYPDEAKRIPQFCNSIPHILLLNFFEPYDEVTFKDICARTCFHKLSYKFTEEQMALKGTYYDVIINNLLCKQ